MKLKKRITEKRATAACEDLVAYALQQVPRDIAAKAAIAWTEGKETLEIKIALCGTADWQLRVSLAGEELLNLVRPLEDDRR